MDSLGLLRKQAQTNNSKTGFREAKKYIKAGYIMSGLAV